MNNKSSILTKRAVSAALAIFCAFLWGSAYPAIKIGYELFHVGSDDTAAKMAYAGLRFALSGVLVLAIRPLMGKGQGGIRTLKKKHWKHIVTLALIQTTIHYTFFYIGLSYTTGSKGAILNASTVFFSALLAHFVYTNDKITLRKGLGVILGFSAVIFVNLDGGFNFSFLIQGEGFIVLAALLHSSSGLYSKHISKEVDPVLLSGLQLGLGGLVLLVIGLLMGASFPQSGLSGYMLMLYLAALSAMAFSIWTSLLKHNKVSSITIFNSLIPVFGAILSAIFLKESIVGLQLFGAIVAVALGIVLVTYSSSKTPV